ncbi:T9SS type A sorting domain-containing protein [Ignavibacteria bacterium CHB1]|nr:hypothetical protein [Ignavibacteria bacterium]MCE7953680.1 T9SS C-terminal target domain-containing protein [Chlorobi bacterium CHB7]MDL1887432.1 T9SS type A sorting domain-containing protein [Ignavibacteria bacterium CHB1]
MDVSNVNYEISTSKRWMTNRRFVGAVLYDGDKFTTYSTTNSGISSNEILGLAIDKNNNKYFGSEFAMGISKLDSSNSNWSVFGFGLYAAREIEIDRNGNIWWISKGVQALGGLFKATQDFNEVSVWNAHNSPLSSDPLSIAIDSNNNKWIGCNNGLFVFNEGGIINIDDKNFTIPDKFILHQNFPNPFNPTTIIKYELKFNATIKLKVYDLDGKLVKTLVNRKQTPGSYSVEFEGNNFSSGVYLYVLNIEDASGQRFRKTKRMLLLK